MTLGEEIRAERAKGMSLFDANHIVRQRRAFAQLEAVDTIPELKELVRTLILETRFSSGVRG